MKRFVLIAVGFFLFFSPLSARAEEEPFILSAEDQVLLDEIQKRALDYFVSEHNPINGLVRDWAWNTWSQSSAPASVAASGFALTAYGVGVERGWLDYGKALTLTRRALVFFRDEAVHEHGFFYHFLNFNTAVRANGSELSPIDTTLALAGILFAREYFADPEIKKLADDIYARIDWAWMLNEGKTFALAWTPEAGFLRRQWTHFDESILMYLLALGSPTHPITKENWDAVRRPIGSYKQFQLVQSPPLFTHQYPHIWFDLRNQNDGHLDYFENSRQATLAHRQFAIDESKNHKSYGPDSWGFSAAEGPSGYKAYGAPPGWASHDGTVVPTACGGSVPFAPRETISCLKFMKTHYGNRLWGRYGFGDAYNVDLNWFSSKVFAINQGPMLLMIENFRSGLVWTTMNRSPYVKEALKKAGFRAGTIPLRRPAPREATARKVNVPVVLDGRFGEWPKNPDGKAVLDESTYEFGEAESEKDLRAEIAFQWDEEFLYLAAEIEDDSLVARSAGSQIFRDDLFELFVDPDRDGLVWYGKKDFQIGFAPEAKSGRAKTWSWFQGGFDPSKAGDISAASEVFEGGYRIEARIRWSFLGFSPAASREIFLSPAVHDLDRGRSEIKANWTFWNEQEANRFRLGRLLLKD